MPTLMLRGGLPWLLIPLLGAVPSVAVAQQGSLQGIIGSSRTGAPLEGVTIVLESNGQPSYGALTDRNGFYQIPGIDPGTYSLRARHLGHVQREQMVEFGPGDRLTVSLRLEPEAVGLEELVVEAGGGATTRSLGRQRITPADLGLIPAPAGSGDLASYLQTLPGVTATGDRGGNLFVRGGTPAENLVLVDGIPIYQPFHIIGFFSVFPEDLISSVDFYAGGFGARYSGRTSSVVDVRLRDGDPGGLRAMGSASPFLAEALVEGPAGQGLTWMASVRRSLVEHTSDILMGRRQPLAFDSQLLKLTLDEGEHGRCSALALRTSDRGRLDPEETVSEVEWQNLVVGGRCVTLFQRFLRLAEANFSYTTHENSAVSRGSSRFRSKISRMQHDAHSTTMLGSTLVTAGYDIHIELMDLDLAELFGFQRDRDMILGIGGYLEAAVPIGSHAEVRPGVALSASPRPGVEPRIRASWQPFGRSSGELQGALGLYRQDLVGASDLRDVGSAFLGWMRAADEVPLEAVHGLLGWQQSFGSGVSWSVEGYYKKLRNLSVPAWRAVAEFPTRLSRADGEVYGADTRIEYTHPRFYGFVGYGYGWTQYELSQAALGSWFGEPVQHYHPAHDRRHQINALTRFGVAGFNLSARWQFGSGFPFTRPLGFDDAFDFAQDFYDVTSHPGTTRLVLDKPYSARLPAMHRLDISLEREFDLSFGRSTATMGVINAYDRRNMFYYDLFSGRRVDQLPFAPYVSLTVRTM